MLIRVSDTGSVVAGLRTSPSRFEDTEPVDSAFGAGALVGSELTPGNYPQLSEQFKPKRRLLGLEFRLPEILAAVFGNCRIGRRRARADRDRNRTG